MKLNRNKIFWGCILNLLVPAASLAANLTISAGSVDLTGQSPGSWVKAYTSNYVITGTVPRTYDSCPSDILLCTTATGTLTNINAYGTGGYVYMTIDKTPVTRTIANGATVIFDFTMDNMAVYYGMQRYGDNYVALASRFNRSTISTFTSGRLGDSTTFFWEGHWNTATTSWGHTLSGCSTYYWSCLNGIAYAGLATSAAKVESSGSGDINIYVQVPQNLSAGIHSFRNLSLGYLSLIYYPDGTSGRSYRGTTRYLYADVTITVPQRCSVTFPVSASFNQIKGTEPPSSTPLETKVLTFVSTCNNLGTATVDATLTISPEELHSSYSAAVFPGSSSSLGITASLTQNLNCYETNNEIFSTGSLLVSHDKNNLSTSRDVYFGLCKFGLITSPGKYETSLNAIVRYNVTN
ncbi:hypothetical protein [Raoultella ornithinolytica]|uniref:hypothetical protein n=1 Tax=Raoultella ornithinolytica TaxID=54291 RepID=UPI000B05790D|nr:hypothetical protein [Raoultella ornithinolytica]